MQGKWEVAGGGGSWASGPAPGITITASSEDAVSFTVAEGFTLLSVCYKAGNQTFSPSGLTNIVGFAGPLTVSKAGPGSGISHVSFAVRPTGEPAGGPQPNPGGPQPNPGGQQPNPGGQQPNPGGQQPNPGGPEEVPPATGGGETTPRTEVGGERFERRREVAARAEVAGAGVEQEVARGQVGAAFGDGSGGSTLPSTGVAHPNALGVSFLAASVLLGSRLRRRRVTG